MSRRWVRWQRHRRYPRTSGQARRCTVTQVNAVGVEQQHGTIHVGQILLQEAQELVQRGFERRPGGNEFGEPILAQR
jgi:hypothetical protein